MGGEGGGVMKVYINMNMDITILYIFASVLLGVFQIIKDTNKSFLFSL